MNICSFLFSPVHTFIQEDEVNGCIKIKESHLDKKQNMNTKTGDVMASFSSNHLLRVYILVRHLQHLTLKSLIFILSCFPL